jgi:hypothetical protein
MNFLDYVGVPIPEGALYPLGWLVALVLAIIIAVKGRSKAGKFLLIICLLIFIFNIIMPFLFGLLCWLTGINFNYGYFYVVLNVIGIILLVIAFWRKPSLNEHALSESEKEEKR